MNNKILAGLNKLSPYKSPQHGMNDVPADQRNSHQKIVSGMSARDAAHNRDNCSGSQCDIYRQINSMLDNPDTPDEKRPGLEAHKQQIETDHPTFFGENNHE